MESDRLSISAVEDNLSPPHSQSTKLGGWRAIIYILGNHNTLVYYQYYYFLACFFYFEIINVFSNFFFLEGNESFEKVASMSLIANMTVYLSTRCNISGVFLTNAVNIWSGSTNLSSILGMGFRCLFRTTSNSPLCLYLFTPGTYLHYVHIYLNYLNPSLQLLFIYLFFIIYFFNFYFLFF